MYALQTSINYAENPHSALKGADCAIIMTEWDQFQKLKAKDFRVYMKTPNVVDARRIYESEELGQVSYIAIGVGPVNPQRRKQISELP